MPGGVRDFRRRRRRSESAAIDRAGVGAFKIIKKLITAKTYLLRFINLIIKTLTVLGRRIFGHRGNTAELGVKSLPYVVSLLVRLV